MNYLITNARVAHPRLTVPAILFLLLFLPVSVVRAQTGCVPSPAGLAGWWPGEGDATDIAGGNLGTALNGVAYASGEVGRAFVFSGAGGHVRVPDSPALRLTNALTVEAWVNPASVGNETVLSKWDALPGFGQCAYNVYLDDQGRVCLTLSASGAATNSITATATNSLTAGAWSHIACTYDGTNVEVYVNGGLSGWALGWTAGIHSGTDDMSIGGIVGGVSPGQVAAPFAGMIDEVSVYSRALAAAEIQAIFNAGSAGKCGLAPVIQTQPQGLVAAVGSNVTLTVAATGTAPLSYQWSFGGTNLAGATTSSLLLPNVQLVDAGVYSVLVSNTVGTVTSSNAVLTAGAAPGITTQPQSQNVIVGSTCSLSVVATGTAPVTYQWQLGGVAIPGATHAYLALTNVQFAASGAYSVAVSNLFGWVQSATATLTVVPVPPPSLLNVDFADSVACVGYAAFGLSTNDFWNHSYEPWALFWALSNLQTAGGVPTAAGLTVQNGGGTWGLTFPNQMYSTYCYAQDNGIITVTVTNLPTGQYDFYLYGHASINSGNTVFEVKVGGTNCGLEATATDSSWSLTNWVEGAQYVVYRSVSVTNGGAPVTILAHPGLGGYTQINGMQIARSTPAAPSLTLQPVSQTAVAGSNVTFQARAVGTPPLGYQWSFNGSGLAGATNASLTLTNLQPSDAGAYVVTVSNPAGAVTSSNAVLTVVQPPVIAVQPQGQTVAPGATVVFSVNANGTPLLSYQWSFNGSNLPGATTSSLVLSDVQLANAGSYTVVVSNAFGTLLSAAAVLVVDAPPLVVTSPQSQTVFVGSTAALSVVATGSAPLTYQWQLGGVAIAGANGAVLTLPNVQLASAGVYSVAISNAFGWAQSGPATLSVMPVSQPDLLNVDFADSESYVGYAGFGLSPNDFWNHSYEPWALFSAMSNLRTAEGTPTVVGVTVQNGAGTWGLPSPDQMYSTYCYAQDDGIITVTITNLPGGQYDLYLYGHASINTANTVFEVGVGGADYGLQATATNSTWSLTNWVEGAQYVVYRAVSVTNGGAPVTVLAHPGLAGLTQINGMQIARAMPAPPAFALQPVSQTVLVGANATFLARAVGSLPLSYQWRLDGTILADATTASLTLTNIQLANAGAYSVTVTNALGTVSSSNAVLTVGQPPVIAIQPQGQTVAVGAAVTLSVTANGAAPLSYQWQFCNTNLPGATASSLPLSNVQWANAGAYSVVVSNLFGTVVSSPAVLVVDAPPMIVTQPQSRSVGAGATVSFSVVATGSAPLTYQWQRGGVAITGATSAALTLPNVQLATAGAYSVAVSNSFGWAQSAAATLAVSPMSQPDLLDVDFADGVAAVGYAAFGLSTNDVWNHSYQPWALFSAMSNLQTADGVPTAVGLTVQNGGGTWGFASPNPMYATYCYAQDNGIITVTVTNLPTGQYDFYLYGHAAANSANSVFEVTVGGTDYGLLATATDSTWSLANWVEGAQYVVYRSVWVTNSGAPVTIQAHPGQSGYSQINGMQIVRSAPVAPSLTLQPVSQAVVAGATVTFQAQAVGAAPLSFQWAFDGTNLVSATNSSLILTNVQMSNAGVYSVTVSNLAGVVASSNAVLSVSFPPALVQAGSASAAGGQNFVLPILLVANGNENGVAFTLDFDPTLLTYTDVSLGGDFGATLLRNTNQATSGLLGVGLVLTSGASFPAGTQQVVLVTFTAAPVGTATNASVGFGNHPIRCQLSDPLANSLPVNFVAGSVSLAKTMFEGDVSPRPGGDGQVTLIDWVQEGRYVAQLDSPADASELQRADCAPAPYGDGQITIVDWVQVGRYAAGLDPLTAVGPTNGGPHIGVWSGPTMRPADLPPRSLQTVSMALGPGQTAPMSVDLIAHGDETALGFTLSFNTNAMSFSGASLGSGAFGATLNVNARQASSGVLGFALALGPGGTFPAGTSQVVQVSFSAPVTAPSGKYPVSFSGKVVKCEVADPAAKALDSGYVIGAITILPPPALTIAITNQAVLLSWPLWATNFAPQRATGDFSTLLSWTSLGIAPTSTTNANMVVLPLSATNTLYRLRSR